MLPSVRDLALFLAPLVVTAIGMVLVSAGLGDRILPKGVLEIGERSGLGIAVGAPRYVVQSKPKRRR